MEKTVGMRIRECRLKMEITQEELAEQICCKKSLISQYENDKVDIKGSVIVELAKILSTTAGYLLNGEVSCGLKEEELIILEAFATIKMPELRKVAVEQLRILANIGII